MSNVNWHHLILRIFCVFSLMDKANTQVVIDLSEINHHSVGGFVFGWIPFLGKYNDGSGRLKI